MTENKIGLSNISLIEDERRNEANRMLEEIIPKEFPKQIKYTNSKIQHSNKLYLKIISLQTSWGSYFLKEERKENLKRVKDDSRLLNCNIGILQIMEWHCKWLERK